MKDYDSISPDNLSEKNDIEEQNADESRRCKENGIIVENYQKDYEEESIWDGSESEFIMDDEARIYEEQQTGIKIDYTLKYEEILSCLKAVSTNKNKRVKDMIKMVLLVLVGITFLILYFINFVITDLIIGIICLILTILVLVIPKLVLRSHAKLIMSDTSTYVEVYPDNIVVGKNGIERNIPLDGSCAYMEYNNLFIVLPPRGEILLIPERSIEPDFLPDIQAMLIAGTEPRNS